MDNIHVGRHLSWLEIVIWEIKMSLCFSDRSSQFASVASSDSEENTGEEDTDEYYRNFDENFGADPYTDSEWDNSDTSEDV